MGAQTSCAGNGSAAPADASSGNLLACADRLPGAYFCQCAGAPDAAQRQTDAGQAGSGKGAVAAGSALLASTEFRIPLVAAEDAVSGLIKVPNAAAPTRMPSTGGVATLAVGGGGPAELPVSSSCHASPFDTLQLEDLQGPPSLRSRFDGDKRGERVSAVVRRLLDAAGGETKGKAAQLMEDEAMLRAVTKTLVQGREISVMTLSGEYKTCRIKLSTALDCLKIDLQATKRRIPFSEIDEVCSGSDVEGVKGPLEEQCVTLALVSGDRITFRCADVQDRDELTMALAMFSFGSFEDDGSMGDGWVREVLAERAKRLHTLLDTVLE